MNYNTLKLLYQENGGGKGMKNQTQVNQTLIVLTKKDLMDLQYKAAEIGAKVALEKLEEEKKNIHKKLIDKRLHNTKLLLKNYGMLKLNKDNSIYNQNQLKESATDILNNMMNLYDDEIVIESIKRSATRTAIIVNHIEKMLELYKLYCKSSKKKWEKRRYNIIYDFYISKQPKSIRQIAEQYHYSRQTIYDDINEAESALSALVFGVDGLRIK